MIGILSRIFKLAEWLDDYVRLENSLFESLWAFDGLCNG